MRDSNGSQWDVPRPSVRLWLTIGLGILGALLFSFGLLGQTHPLSALQVTARLSLWLVSAFAGISLLHRLERARADRREYALRAIAFLFSLLLPSALSNALSVRDGAEELKIFSLALFCSLLVALISAISVVHWLGQRRDDPASILQTLLRGMSIAVAAPLLLFASRPPAGNSNAAAMHPVSRVAFILLPFVFAVGCFSFFWAPVMASHPDTHGAFGFASLSFVFWAWVGSALIFTLSPWPVNPRLLQKKPLSLDAKIGSFVAMGLFAAGLAFFILFSPNNTLQLLFFPQSMPGVWRTMLLLPLLVPWPASRFLPKIDELPRERAMGAWGIALFLSLMVVGTGAAFRKEFLYLANEMISLTQFHEGKLASLEGSPIFWNFLTVVHCCAQVIPYVAVTRWLSDRKSSAGYWAFAAPTIVLFLILFFLLTGAMYWLFQYIEAMGFTPDRLLGLFSGLTAYVVLAMIMRWSLRKPEQRKFAD